MNKFFLLLCLIFFASCNSYVPDYEYEEKIEYSYEEYEPTKIIDPFARESGVVDVYVFGLQSADAIVITTENYVVMIDTGERQHGRTIAEELFSKGIFQVDYLIITHFDRDHVGGAYDIIRFLGVNNIIVPNYQRISNSTRRFEEAKERLSIEAYTLTETIRLNLDDVELVIYPSGLDFFVFGNEEDENDYNVDIVAPRENDFSIIVTMEHGENNFIFAGDAMAVRLAEILEVEEITNTNFDFVKLAHHGRFNRNSEDFLHAINPRYAVSTCCFERPIDERIVGILQELNTEIFLSKNGLVHAKSDGHNLIVIQ